MKPKWGWKILKKHSAMFSRNQVNKSLTAFIFKSNKNTEDNQLERKGTFLVSCMFNLYNYHFINVNVV